MLVDLLLSTRCPKAPDVIIEVYDISLGTTILLDEVKRDDTNNITLTASAAPDALGSGYKVLIKRI